MKQVIILRSNVMGNGDDELGKTIMGALLKKLWASPTKPDTILFYNSAVKLLTKEGGNVEALVEIEKAGVDLVACGTCINHFELGEIAVGRVSGMDEILSIMLAAEKTITI